MVHAKLKQKNNTEFCNWLPWRIVYSLRTLVINNDPDPDIKQIQFFFPKHNMYIYSLGDQNCSSRVHFFSQAQCDFQQWCRCDFILIEASTACKAWMLCFVNSKHNVWELNSTTTKAVKAPWCNTLWLHIYISIVARTATYANYYTRGKMPVLNIKINAAVKWHKCIWTGKLKLAWTITTCVYSILFLHYTITVSALWCSG